MTKENVFFGAAGLIIGLLLGILVGGKVTGGSPSPAPQAVQQSGVATADPAQLSVRITEAEKIVAKDPKNLQAWITLGNDYFDANNPQKSVQAYEKALELDPNNPNVLTDQGIMFRALGFFDRALANFEKANKINPTHLQSLYNQAIVYAIDLKQPGKARPILEVLVQKAGNSEMGNQARQMLQQLPAK